MTAHILAQSALACLDLTDLSDECKESQIEALIQRAATPFGAVAAICIWPQFVPLARQKLKSGIAIATVINFPKGGENITQVLGDVHEVIKDGADEIDLVMPYRALQRGDVDLVREMIEAVVSEIDGRALLKVILETGELQTPALITQASELALAAGADFIKTSTGKTAQSASPEAARLMLEAIKRQPRAAGFKAAGGIRTLADARIYLELAEQIMGPGWAKPEHFRIGASGLLDALLAELTGQKAEQQDGY